MIKVIGIGDYCISNDPQAVLTTYALSSCVALTAYEPNRLILGMVHIALPDSALAKVQPVSRPAHYVDTAVPFLIGRICAEYVCLRDNLVIQIYGGASSIRENDSFKIGPRNLQMMEEILRRMNLKPNYADIGGNVARSLEVDVATGIVKVKYQPLQI